MQKRTRLQLHQRLARIFYIKRELFSKTSKALSKNRYASHYTAYCSDLNFQQKIINRHCISRHRVLCLLNSSPKLVSKNYRLSRFSLNYLSRKNSISGLLKRGW